MTGDGDMTMTYPLRTSFLSAAAILMWIGALGYTVVVLPDLHGDLVEIGVRPTVLGGTVLHLNFAAAAMIGFAVIVSVAAVEALRGTAPKRFQLAVIAVIYGWHGWAAFSRSRDIHHFAPIAMAILLAMAIAMRAESPRVKT